MTHVAGIEDLQYNPWRGGQDETNRQIDYWHNWYSMPANNRHHDIFVDYVRDNYPDYIFPEDRIAIVHEPLEEDVVNHPSHYKTANGLEAIDVLESFGLTRDGRLFNAGKYLLRAGKKDNELQDLKKAVWYLNRYIAEAESNG